MLRAAIVKQKQLQRSAIEKEEIFVACEEWSAKRPKIQSFALQMYRLMQKVSFWLWSTDIK